MLPSEKSLRSSRIGYVAIGSQDAIFGYRESKPHVMQDVRIEVENFGPIRGGYVDLRPLTVFVGRSNTGKSYFATLVFALHKFLYGFPRLPVTEAMYREMFSSETPIEDVGGFVETFRSAKRNIRYSDLPQSVRSSFERITDQEEGFASELSVRLRSCFDVESTSSLILSDSDRAVARFSAKITEGANGLWELFGKISKTRLTTGGSIADIDLFGGDETYSDLVSRVEALAAQRILPEGDDTTRERKRFRVLSQAAEILNSLFPIHSDVYYLPAARSGLMQAYRMVAKSLVSSATRSGSESIRDPGFLTDMVADFLKRLILPEVPSLIQIQHGYPDRLSDRLRPAPDMGVIAGEFESKVLGGEILETVDSLLGLSEYTYRPAGAEEDMRLNRASSMVSELAPLAVFMKKYIQEGDTLILEEPEAHLHAGAQAEIATTLAKLVRKGVKVIVTTHSDWLILQLGNLIREGVLARRDGVDINSLQATLIPSEVGAWWFRNEDPTRGSVVEEIEFDQTSGIEPSDFDDLADALHNRYVDLTTRLG